MSRATTLVENFKKVSELDEGKKSVSIKISGVKDAELAKAFTIDMDKVYSLSDDGKSVLIPEKESVGLDGLKKAFDVVFVEKIGEAAATSDATSIEKLTTVLEKAGATGAVLNEDGSMSFVFDRQQFLLSYV